MASPTGRSERLAWAMAVTGLVLTGVAFALSLTSRSLTLNPVILGNAVFAALSFLVALRFRFVRREEAEAENLQIYREEHPGTELFEDSDEALKLASRASNSYRKFAVPVLSVLVGGGTLAACIFIWRHWTGLPALPEIRDPARYAILAAVLFVAHSLAGSFYVGASRDPGGRWLRPCGSWLLFCGLLWLLASVALFVAASAAKAPKFDLFAGYAGLAAVLILCGELIVNVVIEFYRPRRMGEEDRPVFESRFLALVTEPGGLARNVASSLDYQFGFRISEGALYRFLERSVLPLGVLLVVLLWLSTCLVVIRSDENGIREHFGRVASESALSPGLYAKLPWPFGRIYTFPVQRVQQLAIGYKPGEEGDQEEEPPPEESPEEVGDLTGRIIVWGKRHNKEEVEFVVASQPDEAEEAALSLEGQDRVPVSTYFLSVAMPVFFKVNDLYNYAYKHSSPNHVLEEIATEELARFCSQIDFFDLLTRGRDEAGQTIAGRIQARADAMELGVEVVFLGLHGVHPPVRVGSFFNEVVSASEEKHTTVLEAETDAVSVVANAEGEAATIMSDATGYRYDRTQVARAESERFIKQLQAFAASPELFPLRSLLRVLEEQGKTLRKYVVAVSGGREVVILNLEEKLRQDLLDLNLERED